MDSKCPHCGKEFWRSAKEAYEEWAFPRKLSRWWYALKVTIKSFVERRAQETRERMNNFGIGTNKPILHLKPSMAPVVAMCLVPWAPLLVLLGAAFNAVEQGFGTGLIVGGGIFLGLILLLIGLAYSRTEYIITNRRVIVKSGIITKSERQVHVQDMRDIFLQRGLFQRITGTGSISIGSQTTGLLARIVLDDIKEYSRVIETLESLKGL